MDPNRGDPGRPSMVARNAMPGPFNTNPQPSMNNGGQYNQGGQYDQEQQYRLAASGSQSVNYGGHYNNNQSAVGQHNGPSVSMFQPSNTYQNIQMAQEQPMAQPRLSAAQLIAGEAESPRFAREMMG
jgi:hypothetical protein